MRKFKLIKEYIGSPKLGTISRYTGDLFDKDNDLLPSVVKDKHFFDFWEEVIEKEDYKILSFKQNSSTITGLPTITDFWTEFKNGWARNNNGTPKTIFVAINYLLWNQLYNIHSIKRLSDGEVFTIGDKTYDGKISKFEISEENKLRCFIETTTWISLNLLKKAKQPLFTTSDNVDIYEGNEFYAVLQDYTLSGDSPIVHNEDREIRRNRINKTFSTKEITEEYILMNKPCLSIKEIAPIFGQMYLDDSKSVLNRMTIKLQKLVKSKL